MPENVTVITGEENETCVLQGIITLTIIHKHNHTHCHAPSHTLAHMISPHPSPVVQHTLPLTFSAPPPPHLPSRIPSPLLSFSGAVRAKLFRLNVPDDRLKAITRSLSPIHGLVEGVETAQAQGLGLGPDAQSSNGNGTQASATVSGTASASELLGVEQATTTASVDPSLLLPAAETEAVKEATVSNGNVEDHLDAGASSSGTTTATSSSSSGSSTGGGAEWVEVGIGPVRLLKPKHNLSSHSHTFGVNNGMGTSTGSSFGGVGGGAGDSSDDASATATSTLPAAPGSTPTSTATTTTTTTTSPNRVKRETCRLVMRREVLVVHPYSDTPYQHILSSNTPPQYTPSQPTLEHMLTHSLNRQTKLT